MFQQTQTAQDSKIAYKASHGYVQSFARILQIVSSVIRKIAVISLSGFHTFVGNAEQHRPSHNDYWWDSPDTVAGLFKR